MDEKQRGRLAAARAQAYAPKPTGGALMAGVCAAAVLGLADVSLSRFYGWPLPDHLWLTAALVTAGFLIGALGYLRLRRLNRKARHAERTQIDAEQARRKR